ncbi:GNAT family N-acetyltransferase [Flavobacterium psychrotrophum]|uniref:GNAT family N-acetyltransferase n=1 Tax=Flavobacterium psychrotrophum TaxID=2294119 RepID=UPI000E30DA43|nr:GNAT family N-acetyltransferase [Flavobacterium psychrotrophum]
MPFNIIQSHKEDIKTILDCINSYNQQQVAALAEVWTPLEFSVKDDNDTLIGGLLGGIGAWNGFEIRILWVAETHRGSGIGGRLLQHAENAARQKGATIAMLDTFSFQAEAFYLKHGYTAVGEIKDFPLGHRRIYFSKTL